MKTLKQILNDIRVYKFCVDGGKTDPAQELSYKIDLLLVIVEIFYTHLCIMDEPIKLNSFLKDIEDIENLQKLYSMSHAGMKGDNENTNNHKRIQLDNVWYCETYILSKYNGENGDFIKRVLIEVKTYFTREYGALMDLEDNYISLYSETPQNLHDAILNCIKNGVDPHGKKIVNWNFEQKTGLGSGVIVCKENNLDKTYNLLLNVKKDHITITSHYKSDSNIHSYYSNSEMRELLIRFGRLWKTQLTSLA